MKIGIVVWDLNIKGGTQRQALELARHLREAGEAVTVYSAFLDRDSCYPDLMEGLDIRSTSAAPPETGPVFDFLGRFTPAVEDSRNGPIYEAVVELLDTDLDVLCCVDYGAYSVGGMAKETKKFPVVWQLNDLPFPHSKSAGVARVLKNIVKRLLGWKSVERKHEAHIRRLDRIVVMDRLNRNKLMERYGLEGVIVRNGLDIGAFRFNERPGPGTPLKVMSNGIFFPWRRLEDLVDALAILKGEGKSFEWHHVGTDERCAWYAKTIYDRVKEKGLTDRVTFHGRVGEKELIELYATSDAFVFPNSPQTWGLAVFEAMGCGTPAVVSTGCGASEVLTHGETALLVEPGSPQGIADSLRRLADEEDLWGKIHTAGRAFVERDIRWEGYAAGMKEIFQAVTGGQGEGTHPSGT